MRRLGVSQSRGRGLRVCSVQEHSYFLHPSVVVARRGGGGGGGGGGGVAAGWRWWYGANDTLAQDWVLP